MAAGARVLDALRTAGCLPPAGRSRRSAVPSPYFPSPPVCLTLLLLQDAPYDPSQDSVLQRVRFMFGES